MQAHNSDSNENLDESLVADHGIKFEDWGFKVNRLFEVALWFYKRNESKAFYPTFDERNKMNALILQAKYGNFDESRSPNIGVLDLVGKSRRHEWSLLNGMSKTEAMSKFICTLDEICPIFKAHAEAVKISSGLKSSTSHESIGTRIPQSTNGKNQETETETDEQLKAIRKSLYKQTYNQFKSYAEKHHPNDKKQQNYLISSLQEQYYQQYISQMHPKLIDNTKTIQDHEQKEQMSNFNTSPPSSSSPGSSGTENRTTMETCDYTTVEMGPPVDQAYQDYTQTITNVESAETVCGPSDSHTECHSKQIDDPPILSKPYFGDIQESDHSHNSNENEKIVDNYHEHNHNVDTNLEQVDCCDLSSDGATSPLQQSFSYEPLEPANLWTKRGVHEFRESLADDGHGGAYLVKQGSLVTINVPTYPDGRFLHFEFATEDYDIGFGLDFIYESYLSEPLAINIREESDDDEDEDEFDDAEFLTELYKLEANGQGVDIESPMPVNGIKSEIMDRKRAERLDRESRTVSIVPTYRRDSHEEVFVGRHRYPGKGYYILKFDNTYSVLRSKSLYFRICYLM